MARETIYGQYAAAAGCMDGRIWPAVQEFALTELGADNVDVVAAEPGFVRTASRRVSKRVLERLKISTEHHGVTDLIVFGHSGCVGNPIEDGLHEQQTLQAASRYQDALPSLTVIPVFVKQRVLADGIKWTARRLTPTVSPATASGPRRLPMQRG